MKLYYMTEYETWIGPSLDACKEACVKNWGGTFTEHEEELEDACELSDADLDNTMVDLSDDADGSGPVITARELLAQEIAKGGEFPRFAYGQDW